MDSEPHCPDSLFAPGGRRTDLELSSQVEYCVNSPLAKAILASLDGFVVVLNAQRQIVAANNTLLEALKREGLENPVGMRWGEANSCVQVSQGPDGCGTAPACRYCGAALGILAAQEGPGPVAGECRMSIRRGGRWEAREFEVRITRLAMPFGEVIVPVFHDISDRHRREVLESAFLHDMANTLTALSCWSELMKLGSVDPAAAAARIADISTQLSDVVSHQRQLIQAEQGELSAETLDLDVDLFLASLQGALGAHPLALDKGITIAVAAEPGARVRTDPVLLLRILSNMGINAIEACAIGAVITLGLTHPEGRPRFKVHNPGVIPEPVARQIFQRSFSTKGTSGRGLGTYAMKIFGENMLGGQVGFLSEAGLGTEFFVHLPR